MKRLTLQFVWQWRNWEGYIKLHPLSVKFEYDMFSPSIAFQVVVLGVGLTVFFVCPWTTKYSEWAEEIYQNFFISLGGDLKEEAQAREKIEWREYEPPEAPGNKGE